MKKKLIVTLALCLCLTVCAEEANQQDIQRFSLYYSNGMENMKNQQYSSAITDFKKVLRFSPYDSLVQNALANAYFARAQYFRQTTKEIKKAVVDYKNAYFYSKLWSKTVSDNSMLQLANSCQKSITELEKRMEQNQDSENRLLSAKTHRAQGDLGAASYDFYQLLDSKYSEFAYENLTNIYKNLNNLSMAMDFAKDTLDKNPKNAKMHFIYGVMLDEAKNYEASMEQYNLALQYGDKSPELMEVLENKWTQNIVNNPTNAQNYINLGAIYQKQGHYDLAKTQYLKAIHLDNTDDTALYNLASLYIQQKNIQEAIGVYNKLLAKHPDNVEILNYKASILYEAKRYDEALKIYESILKLDSKNKLAKQMADDIIYNRFGNDKLLAHLETQALNNPNNCEAQFSYAYELHKNKRLAAAAEYYKKALEANPAKEEAYINLAQIYIELGFYDKAQVVCEKGLMIVPENKTLKTYISDCKNYSMNNKFEGATELFKQGKFEEALNEYQAIPNKTKEVNMAIAGCYWELNDYANANKYYLEVLKNEPNNKEALVNSAYAYFSMKNYNLAKQTAQKVLNIDKTNKQALDIISNIENNEITEIIELVAAQYEKNDFNAALNTANKILNQKPNNEYGLYYKALSLDGLKKYKEAGWIYRLLIQKHPDFVNAYYSLAVSLDNQENYKEAIPNYEQFVKKSTEQNEMTEFAQSRIKELKTYLGQLNAKK